MSPFIFKENVFETDVLYGSFSLPLVPGLIAGKHSAHVIREDRKG
jgi:hypothetical protein